MYGWCSTPFAASTEGLAFDGMVIEFLNGSERGSACVSGSYMVGSWTAISTLISALSE